MIVLIELRGAYRCPCRPTEAAADRPCRPRTVEPTDRWSTARSDRSPKSLRRVDGVTIFEVGAQAQRIQIRIERISEAVLVKEKLQWMPTCQDHGVCRNTTNESPCDAQQMPAHGSHEHGTPAPSRESFRSVTDCKLYTDRRSGSTSREFATLDM